MAGTRRENTPNDLLIVIVTCVSAPLLAHVLDLLYGEANPWKSDRLVVLYFAAVAGYIISAKCIRLLKRSSLYERGLKLGDSDAFQNLFWAFPVLLVTYCYDYLPGVFITAILFLTAIVILYRDGENVCINVAALCVSGILTMAIAALAQMLPVEWSASEWIMYLLKLLIAQTFVCLMFDAAAYLIKKRKKQKEDKRDSQAV